MQIELFHLPWVMYLFFKRLARYLKAQNGLFKYFIPKEPIDRMFGYGRGTPLDRYFIERFINPTIEYSVHSAKKKYPKTAALIGKLVASKLEAKKNQLDLLDSTLFRKYRKYMIYLFQKQND